MLTVLSHTRGSWVPLGVLILPPQKGRRELGMARGDKVREGGLLEGWGGVGG